MTCGMATIVGVDMIMIRVGGGGGGGEGIYLCCGASIASVLIIGCIRIPPPPALELAYPYP